MTPESDPLQAAKTMRLEILRKGPHGLYRDRDGLLISVLVGSDAEKATERIPRFTLIGVYDEKSKINNIVEDIKAR